MPPANCLAKAAARKQRLAEAAEFLRSLGFGPRQTNETAAYEAWKRPLPK